MLCGDTMQRSLGKRDQQTHFALDKTSRFREGNSNGLLAPPPQEHPYKGRFFENEMIWQTYPIDGTGSVRWERLCLLKYSLMPFESGKFHVQTAAPRGGPKRQRDPLGW